MEDSAKTATNILTGISTNHLWIKFYKTEIEALSLTGATFYKIANALIATFGIFATEDVLTMLYRQRMIF